MTFNVRGSHSIFRVVERARLSSPSTSIIGGSSNVSSIELTRRVSTDASF